MLTDAKCRAARAEGKNYKLADTGGLYLFVSTSGHRSWRLKYRVAGKEKLRVLGTYPELGLREARAVRDEDKKLLRQGKDPSLEAKRIALVNRVAGAETFELLGREWHSKQIARWKAVHAADVIESLDRDIFPTIGPLPITQIDAPLILAVLQKVESRGAVETAHRLRQRISAIFGYAIAKGQALHDPAAPLGKALAVKPTGRRWPAAKTIPDARNVLAVCDSAEASPIVKLAARFLALTAQRPGMVRWLRWDELHHVDLYGDNTSGNELWRVPAAKMKQEITLREDEAFDHDVPLSAAAVDVIRHAYMFSSSSDFVFCGGNSIVKPISENALSYLHLREGLRGRHVPHGWRATFSTVMNEWSNEKGQENDRMVIDLMLAHAPAGLSATELRYNRAAYMIRRRILAEIWTDMLLQGAAAVGSLCEGRRRRKK